MIDKEKQYVHELIDKLFEVFPVYDVTRDVTFEHPNLIGKKVRPYEECEEVILTFRFRKGNY